jgi:hypothetical protein
VSRASCFHVVSQALCLIGEFNDWKPADAHWAFKDKFGVWELFLPDKEDGTPAVPHRSKVGAGGRPVRCVHKGLRTTFHTQSKTEQPCAAKTEQPCAASQCSSLAFVPTGASLRGAGPGNRPIVVWTARQHRQYACTICRVLLRCMQIKCRLETPAGTWVERIPAWIKWATQEWNEVQFNGELTSLVKRHDQAKRGILAHTGLMKREGAVGQRGAEGTAPGRAAGRALGACGLCMGPPGTRACVWAAGPQACTGTRPRRAHLARSAATSGTPSSTRGRRGDRPQVKSV